MAEGGATKTPELGAAAGVIIDPVTGLPTTGHSWDGITELNRPLPRWWLWTFYACIAFAAVWVVLYPSIPLIRGGTSGVLGYSTRAAVEGDLATARQAQAGRLEQVASLSLQEIGANADLARFAVAGGHSAFLVNCVPCHGSGAAGSKGYPNLNDDDWLWGGTLDAIHQTISHGIRAPNDDETRDSAMPAFGGPDGSLSAEQINDVAEYVLSLAGKPHDEAAADAGAAVFGESGANCASCHGAKGEGNRELGAPALNDAITLKGADKAAIVAQIVNPKMGVMPAWAGRLSPTVIKELTLYVYSLGGGEAATDSPAASN